VKVAIEPVYDSYGGMYPYVSGIKQNSSCIVREVPSPNTRIFLNRSKWLKEYYKKKRLQMALNGFETVHSMADPWFIDLCSRSQANGCRWVHTYHIMFFEEDYAGGLAPWQEETNNMLINKASNADIRISTSRWMHDYLLDNYSIATDIVMGAIDVELCQRASAERFIKNYGYEGFFVFVGSIREVKDPALFIDLAESMPGEQFVMIGPNLTAHDVITTLGKRIPENLMLMGKMPREGVLDAIAASKAFVLTSKHEGFPQVVLEAMAIGKPVVASAYLGSRDIIPNDRIGFLYDPGDIEDLKIKVKASTDQPEVGDNAREWVSNNFSWNDLIKKIDKFYKG